MPLLVKNHTHHSDSLFVRTRQLVNLLHIDVPLLAILLLLCGAGFFILYSAGAEDQKLLNRQIIRIAAAFFGMLVIAQCPPHLIRRVSPSLYLLGIALLIAVLLFGQIGKGAQRWLDLGFMRFQPSELLKLATPMMIAWFFARHPLPPRWFHFIVAGILIVIPTLLIAKQPDLGTSLLIAVAGFAVIFYAGLAWRFMIALTVAAAGLTPILWNYMHDYQRNRVLTFLNPEADPLGKGYHIIQSKIAIGSGGIYGTGWLQGTQSRLDFLPESSTDFIFSVFAEEFGLFGALVLLAVYLLITIRCFNISLKARDSYQRLLGGSLSITFFIYVFVNIGMVIGILPVVGVPLPLVSYGGTSMVTLLAGFGILMSIQTHKEAAK